MEILTEAPKSSSFVPLAEHQSATPASFYNGPPVLHYYSDRCKLIILESEANIVPALANIISKAPSNSQPNGNGAVRSDADPDSGSEERKVIEDIDVWVTSDKLLVYSTPLSTGLSISYPNISLHAIQSLPEPSSADTSSQGLYMQLVYSSGDTTQSEDTEPESISVTIIPTATAPPQPQQLSADGISADIANEDLPEQTPVAAMFAALSNCSNLHPDPVDDDDEEEGGGGGDAMDMDGGALAGSRLYQSGLVMPGGTNGGLPPPMSGSGGWITAENMHEFFDQEGNWIGPEDGGDGDEQEEEEGPGSESLGPGAGTTRPRDVDGADGDAAAEEVKWRRTDG